LPVAYTPPTVQRLDVKVVADEEEAVLPKREPIVTRRRPSPGTAKAVQTDVVARHYKFVKLAYCRDETTQTSDEYLPYDEETRDRIAHILGNKTMKYSDLAGNILQSLGNRLDGDPYLVSRRSASGVNMQVYSGAPKHKEYSLLNLKCRRDRTGGAPRALKSITLAAAQSGPPGSQPTRAPGEANGVIR